MLPFSPIKQKDLAATCGLCFQQAQAAGSCRTLLLDRGGAATASGSQGQPGGLLSMFLVCTHIDPVPLWLVGMKAPYPEKTYTCIQTWVPNGSLQQPGSRIHLHTIPLSSLATHKHMHRGISAAAGLDFLVPSVANVIFQEVRFSLVLWDLCFSFVYTFPWVLEINTLEALPVYLPACLSKKPLESILSLPMLNMIRLLPLIFR